MKDDGHDACRHEIDRLQRQLNRTRELLAELHDKVARVWATSEPYTGSHLWNDVRKQIGGVQDETVTTGDATIVGEDDD